MKLEVFFKGGGSALVDLPKPQFSEKHVNAAVEYFATVGVWSKSVDGIREFYPAHMLERIRIREDL